MNADTLELLKCTREKIADPERWTVAAYARDSFSEPVDFADPEAARWCLLGALRHCAARRARAWMPAYEVLADAIKSEVAIKSTGVTQFNDHSTHKEVLALLDGVIAQP